nr:uncharacterized protein LOC113401087 [Vanessa tameamea]
MILSRELLVSIYFVCIYCVDGESNNYRDEKVVLVAPVLAPIKNPRARVVETAKDFPIIRLLSTDNTTKTNDTDRKEDPQPIYVEKIEDQVHRRKRLSGYN